MTAALLNGVKIKSLHAENSNIINFQLKVKLYHLFLHVINKVLASLGKLCDSGMKIIFTKKKITIINKVNEHEVIMMGIHSLNNGTFHLNFTNKSNERKNEIPLNNQQVNSVYELRKKMNC